MNILKDLIAQDNNITTLIAHKLVHISAGCIAALIVLHFHLGILPAVLAALAVGIIRELEKTCSMALHIVVALITASGSGLAIIIHQHSPSVQICCVVVMVVYSVIITILQENNVNL